MRESEPYLGRRVADSDERTMLIGAVPGKCAICTRAAVALKAIIGLQPCDPEIDREFRHGDAAAASFECKSQENSSPFRVLNLEVQAARRPSWWLRGVVGQQKGPVGQE